MSNFSGLSTGYSALLAYQRRINVVSENIANINTPGYHRQSVELESLAAPRTVGFWSGRLDTGGGVQVKAINRAGSSILEGNARRSVSVAKQMETEASIMLQVEDAIGGLSDRGIRAELDAMWNGFDDLANLPEDLGVRRVTLERADAVARSMQSAAKELDSLHQGQLATAEVQVSRVNELASSIAALDQQIIGAQSSGASPNALFDQRGQMINELSTLVGVNVQPEGDGQVSITLDGYLLVAEGRSRSITFQVEPAPPTDSTGLSVIGVVASDGRVLEPSGGSLGGLVHAANSLIRGDREALDNLAVAIADGVNALHRSGVGLGGATGYDLFTVPTGAVDIRLSDDLDGYPERLAAGSVGAGALDESNARALANLGDDPDGPTGAVSELIDSLSVRVSAASSRALAAKSSADYATGLADTSSGVSLDQELTELITAQRSYEAAARLITAADQMLQTLMSTGLVGR